MFKDLFKLRGELDPTTTFIISTGGFVFFLGLWHLVASMGWVHASLLPSPYDVIASFKELHFEDALVRNALYSIKLNVLGYVEAVAICLPLGFIIGLFPFFREMCRKYLDAVRFVPLTACVGVFIAWFGIDTNMKVQFLAFGIIVYLLPVVVQRIQEVDETYVQTLQTLSKSKWDTIREVFLPGTMEKVFDDIRVLVAISWTYIIIAEMVNKSGGVGALAFKASRESRIDKVFGVLLIIILIGFIQDKLFKLMDKFLFPHKYVKEK